MIEAIKDVDEVTSSFALNASVRGGILIVRDALEQTVFGYVDSLNLLTLDVLLFILLMLLAFFVLVHLLSALESFVAGLALVGDISERTCIG